MHGNNNKMICAMQENDSLLFLNLQQKIVKLSVDYADDGNNNKMIMQLAVPQTSANLINMFSSDN